MDYFLQRMFRFFLFAILWAGLFFSLLEFLLLNIDLTFSLKAKHFEKNADNIDVLILGSSHHDNGINPGDFEHFLCSNLAYSAQDLRIDSAIFNHLESRLQKVKYVLVELSYHSLEQRLDKNYSNNNLYLIYYGINLFERPVRWLDRLIYPSNPDLYNKILNPFQDRPSVNEFGFQTKLKRDFNHNRFEMLGYNQDYLLQDTTNPFIQRHAYEDLAFYEQNKRTLFSLIDIVIQSGKIPVLISPPVYLTYRAAYIPEKQKRRMACVHELQKKHPDLLFLEFDSDARFNRFDFRDEDHLNPIGAKKFSQIIEDTLLQLDRFEHPEI